MGEAPEPEPLIGPFAWALATARRRALAKGALGAGRTDRLRRSFGKWPQAGEKLGLADARTNSHGPCLRTATILLPRASDGAAATTALVRLALNRFLAKRAPTLSPPVAMAVPPDL